MLYEVAAKYICRYFFLEIFQKRATKSHPLKVAQKMGEGAVHRISILFLVLYPPEEMPCSEYRFRQCFGRVISHQT